VEGRQSQEQIVRFVPEIQSCIDMLLDAHATVKISFHTHTKGVQRTGSSASDRNTKATRRLPCPSRNRAIIDPGSSGKTLFASSRIVRDVGRKACVDLWAKLARRGVSTPKVRCWSRPCQDGRRLPHPPSLSHPPR
jgi:hypothetical protein